ncbi:MAG: hypothetical protein R6U57_12980 [Anaerolineales bacterium]
MDKIDKHRAICLVNILERFIDETGQYTNQYSIYPEKGSQADNELKTFPRQESVHTAHSQGSSLIEVSADHIMALIKTITEPVQTVAPWVCLRSALESAALATWILDPSIDAHTRVQRSFALRYEGFTQQAKIARALKDTTFLKKVEGRIDEVEELALSLGYKKVTNKNNKRIGIAQNMKPLTNIVRDSLSEEATYRYLSAITHANFWALQQVSFQEVDENDVDITLMPHTKIIEKSMSPIIIAYLCSTAATVFSKPIWFKSKLFSWDLDQMRSILDSNFDVLDIDESKRIWR